MNFKKRINKMRGMYYSNRGKIKKKISGVDKKVRSSINAVKSVWSPQNIVGRKIDDNVIIEKFFNYCRDLENHNYYQSYVSGGSFNLKVDINENETKTELNFDDLHLETFLTSLRQFLFENELYYIDDLIESVPNVFGSSPELENYLSEMKRIVSNPIQFDGGIVLFDSEGNEFLNNINIKELIEMVYGSNPFRTLSKYFF